MGGSVRANVAKTATSRLITRSAMPGVWETIPITVVVTAVVIPVIIGFGVIA